jgi:hypothetical protein
VSEGEGDSYSVGSLRITRQPRSSSNSHLNIIAGSSTQLFRVSFEFRRPIPVPASRKKRGPDEMSRNAVTTAQHEEQQNLWLVTTRNYEALFSPDNKRLSYRPAGERIFNFSQHNNNNDLVFKPYLVYIIYASGHCKQLSKENLTRIEYCNFNSQFSY